MAKTFLYATPILPSPKDYPMNKMREVESSIYRTLRGPVTARLKRAFEDRVRGWSEKPAFPGIYKRTADTFELDIRPTARTEVLNKYRWVTLGTDRSGRRTVARKAPYLKFQRYYRAHTRPGNRYAQAGGGTRYGPTIRMKSVPMSSIEARDFEGHIRDDHAYFVVRDIQRGIDQVLYDVRS